MESEAGESTVEGQDASATAGANDATDKKLTVFLTSLDSADMERIRGWRNDFSVMRWCRQSDFISDLEQQRWFQAQSQDPTIRMYAIKVHVQQLDGVKVFTAGVCGLTSLNLIHRHAEFSIYIGPENHGKGLGGHALHCLLSHGFENMGLNMIWGEVLEGNPAADLYERFGFHHDGETDGMYYKDGKYWRASRYSIRAAEWKVFKDRASTGSSCSTL